MAVKTLKLTTTFVILVSFVWLHTTLAFAQDDTSYETKAHLNPAQTDDVFIYLPVVVKSPKPATATPTATALPVSTATPTASPATGWTAQVSNTNQNLLSVSCSSSNHCVVVGDTGTVLVTTDGSSWETKESGTSQQLNGVSCASDSFCIAVGDNNTVLRSTDGGNSWSNESTGSADWQAVDCPSTSRCVATGGTGIIGSFDGGSNWLNQSLGNTPLYGIDCPSDGHCYMVGLGRVIGVNLSGPSVIPGINEGQVIHNDIDCPDDDNDCFMVSDTGEIRFTTSSPNNWDNQTSGTSHNLKGLSCVSTSQCYGVGGTDNSGIIVATSDGGGNWQNESIAISDKILRGVHCPDETACYAVGDGGTILKH